MNAAMKMHGDELDEQDGLVNTEECVLEVVQGLDETNLAGVIHPSNLPGNVHASKNNCSVILSIPSHIFSHKIHNISTTTIPLPQFCFCTSMFSTCPKLGAVNV